MYYQIEQAHRYYVWIYVSTQMTVFMFSSCTSAIPVYIFIIRCNFKIENLHSGCIEIWNLQKKKWLLLSVKLNHSESFTFKIVRRTKNNAFLYFKFYSPYIIFPVWQSDPTKRSSNWIKFWVLFALLDVKDTTKYDEGQYKILNLVSAKLQGPHVLHIYQKRINGIVKL